jgi:hypothetical protein
MAESERPRVETVRQHHGDPDGQGEAQPERPLREEYEHDRNGQEEEKAGESQSHADEV